MPSELILNGISLLNLSSEWFARHDSRA